MVQTLRPKRSTTKSCKLKAISILNAFIHSPQIIFEKQYNLHFRCWGNAHGECHDLFFLASLSIF